MHGLHPLPLSQTLSLQSVTRIFPLPGNRNFFGPLQDFFTTRFFLIGKKTAARVISRSGFYPYVSEFFEPRQKITSVYAPARRRCDLKIMPVLHRLSAYNVNCTMGNQSDRPNK